MKSQILEIKADIKAITQAQTKEFISNLVFQSKILGALIIIVFVVNVAIEIFRK